MNDRVTQKLADYQARIDRLVDEFTNETDNPERRKQLANEIQAVTNGMTVYKALASL
jgi:hypothetical protein